jgi:hypothetical protein
VDESVIEAGVDVRNSEDILAFTHGRAELDDLLNLGRRGGLLPALGLLRLCRVSLQVRGARTEQ